MTVGTMSRMDRKGDTKIIWDSENEEEVEAARRTFDDLRSKGFLAYKVVGKDGRKSNEQIRTFEPTAERIILAPPMRGG